MARDQDYKPKPRVARGFQDRRGGELSRERSVIAAISRVFEHWGFEPLETPALEYADALGKFLPDQDRPNEGVFALQDDDSHWLALRYDLTAPLARFVAEHFDSLPKPYRRWAAGRVWRNEKPGPGRYREFTQCDADSVGAPGPAADAEMIALACAALSAAGLKDGAFALKLSTRRLLNGLLEGIGVAEADGARRLTVLRAIDKLDRLGPEAVALLLGPGRKDESGDFTKGAGLAPAHIEAVLAFLQAGAGARSETLARLASALPPGAEVEAGLAELTAIDSLLTAQGVGSRLARIDPSIVRGLEYYTGAVFEAELLAGGQALGSIGGGGRYDGLVARFRGQPAPATGFSVGVSRLVAALEGAGPLASPVVVLVLDAAEIAASFAMAAELRAAGVAAEVYLGGAGLKAQLKYADKRGAPVAVLQGEEERARGVVTLKDLKLGAELSREIADREAWRAAKPAQIECPREALVAHVQALLGARQ